MSIGEFLATILATASIPSAVTGLCVWMIQRKITKNSEEQRKREAWQKEYQVLAMESMRASTVLAEATAHALQRGHTNGDMESALELTAKAQQKQKQFLIQHGIESIFDD